MPFRLFAIALLTANVSMAGAADNPVAPAPTNAPHVLKNVSLSETGLLSLQIVDEAGISLPQITVRVTSHDNKSSWVTDETGRVSVPGLRRGICHFAVGDQQFACRVWQHDAAPPKSLTTIALVNEDLTIVRGNPFKRRNKGQQNCCNECEKTRRLSSEAKHGLGILALGGAAAYFALSRDNASD